MKSKVLAKTGILFVLTMLLMVGVVAGEGVQGAIIPITVIPAVPAIPPLEPKSRAVPAVPAVPANPSKGVPPFLPPDSDDPSSPKSNVSHILISQVQITGGSGSTTNDFIEIYNPIDEPYNLKGHRLVKRTQGGETDTLIKSWTSDAFIPAYGFYLWANSGYTTIVVVPDDVTTLTIADNNGIAIRLGANDTGEIIDSVAWGDPQNIFSEGDAFPENPGANQSLLRKVWKDGCKEASFDVSLGNGCDTDNNFLDFELMLESQPRNSQSLN